MCVAQGNILGKVIGSDNFAKIDPLAGAVERFDNKNVAPMWKNMVNPQIDIPKALTYQESKSPTGTKATTRPGVGGTMLTGYSGVTSGALTGKTTILGQ